MPRAKAAHAYHMSGIRAEAGHVSYPRAAVDCYKTPLSAPQSSVPSTLAGDIMYYDEDGRVYFVDRVKDIIKCLDQQVSSVELESLLQSHGSVADAAVVGVQDTRYGDAPAAFVVLRNSSKPPAEIAAELKALVADQTEKFKHLYGGVVFVDRLPRNTNGKVMKQQLKAMYEKCNVY
ncbi:hypothetical protein V5799_029127 [Amblyomma americanum]|uniref:AMP-binding enzyme C-terminal domain-containing protein n=1 Tax=Amblyomma americanum TaxID=6943 RepID=A0AAQ4ESD4_AMBAM